MSAKIDFEWATNENHPAGLAPWNGLATKVAPSTGEQESGFQPSQRPDPETFNFLISRLTNSARFLQNRGFVGDSLRLYPDMPVPNGGMFITEVRDADAPRAIRRHWLIDATNIYRSEDGYAYDAGQAHGVTGALHIGYTVGERAIAVGTLADAAHTSNSIPADQTTLNLNVDVTGGAADDVRDLTVHYRDGGTQYVVIVHENGEIGRWVSGGAWTQLDIGTEDLTSVLSANGVLVAAHATGSADGLVVSDDDGDTWNNKALAGLVSLGGYQIAYLEEPVPNIEISGFDRTVGLWVALGEDRLYTSVDNGVNWVEHSSNVTAYNRGRSISSGGFTLGGGTGVGFTFGVSEGNTSIATDGQRLFAIVQLNGGQSRVAWSEDGLNWFLTDITANGIVRLISMVSVGGRGGGYVIFRRGTDVFRTDSVRTGVSPLSIP